MNIDFPIDLPIKRGRMVFHPALRLVGFHQDGERAVLLKTKKTKDRGLSTKKVGSASTVTLVAHPKGIGAQSRTSIAFHDHFGNKLASVSTKHSFSVDGFAMNGVWGTRGGIGDADADADADAEAEAEAEAATGSAPGSVVPPSSALDRRCSTRSRDRVEQPSVQRERT